MARAAAVMSLVLLTLGACSSNPTEPLAPFEPEVSNATDNFQLQATDVTEVGAALQYTWVNTGSEATVDHSTTLTSGTARVMVRDANGVMVYDHALVPSLNETTATGQPGTWTVNLVLVDYSGTLNFRLQKN